MMKAFFPTCVVALSLLLISPSAAIAEPVATAAPVRYNFQLIADTSGPFKEFRSFAMNKSGLVAFVARHGTADDVGVFTGRGGGLLTTITNTGAGNFVSINDAGTVAFAKATAFDNSGGGMLTGGGLFTGQGGALTTVVSEGFIQFPSINERGSIAFRRVFGDGRPHAFAFVSIGGRVTQIPDSYDACQPAVNNKNTVLFGRCAPFIGSISTSQAGERPILIADTFTGPFTNLTATTINDWGTIAFLGQKKNGEEGVFTITRGQIRTIASRGFVYFRTEIALNNNGAVAFAASLTAEQPGIFTGPDPVADKVIMVGDSLLGSKVTALAFSREGLNDKGELAFLATLENGKQVIVRAAPTSHLLNRPVSLPGPVGR